MPRAKFTKTGTAIWMSHLDLMRLLQRAFRRGGLLLKHSQGYTPHPALSLALPLSVGVSSSCELMDFELAEGQAVEPEELRRRLNAALPAGVETRPDNILIYATSNRRHLVKETWKDHDDMEFRGEIHRSDTMEEKLSLAARFGVAINFNAPNRQQYHDIVKALAARELSGQMDEEQLLLLANRWEIRHGGVSGRTAQQFIHYLAGKEPENHGNT